MHKSECYKKSHILVYTYKIKIVSERDFATKLEKFHKIEFKIRIRNCLS